MNIFTFCMHKEDNQSIEKLKFMRGFAVWGGSDDNNDCKLEFMHLIELF